uniref:Ctr_69_N conopeptide n=1 Tax=Conus tribblei TaxID=101761 RepID=A0A0C9R747_CONTD
MFSHTSVRFLLLSIIFLGMAAAVLSSCDYHFGETCEEERVCACSNHLCCTLSSAKKDQCMTQSGCHTAAGGNGRRRAIQRQDRLLSMQQRGLAS